MQEFTRFKRLGTSVLLLLGAALLFSACSRSETAPSPIRSSQSQGDQAAQSDSTPIGSPTSSRPSDAPPFEKPNGTGQYHDNGDEPIVFDWTPVSALIKGYPIEIQREENNRWFPFLIREELRTWTQALPPGLYRARIWGIYPDGGLTAKSGWIVFSSGAASVPDVPKDDECCFYIGFGKWSCGHPPSWSGYGGVE